MSTPQTSQTSRMVSPGGAVPGKLQQVRLQSGDLVWAVAKEILPGGGGAGKKVLLQVICPVVPGAPPPILVKNPPLAPPGPRAPPPPRTVLRPQGPGRVMTSGTLVPPQSQSLLRPLRSRGIKYTVPIPANVKRSTTITVQKRPELPQPPQPPLPRLPSHSNGSSNSFINRMVDDVINNYSDHSYPQSTNEMDDEIEEIDPHDPLAFEEGVDPLAGLDPYEDVDKEITIVS